MIYKNEITIIGLGMNGLLCGAIFSKLGFDINIVDQINNHEEVFKNDKRTTAISAKVKNLLEKYNIWDKIKQFASPINHIYTFEIDETPALSFDKKGADSMGYVIENFNLKPVLFGLIKENLVIKDEVINIDNSYINQHSAILLKSGKKIESKLVIACDGKYSKIPSFLSEENIKRHEFDYNQTAIIFNIKHKNEHKKIAIEQFTVNGSIASLPLVNKNTSGIVWSLRRDLANYLYDNQDKIEEYFKKDIQRLRHFGDIENIKIIGNINKYPLKMSFLSKQIVNRVIFIGDGFNAIHPIAGQGFNLACRDIERMVEVIKLNKKSGLDIGFLPHLLSLKRKNLFDHIALCMSSDFLVRGFVIKMGLIKKARNIGMDLVESVPFVKNKCMKYAMGESIFSLLKPPTYSKLS